MSAQRIPLVPIRVPAVLVLLLLAPGCGNSALPLVSVSGKVTLDGAPVAAAKLVFRPQAASGQFDAGVSSSGVTDAAGRYTLTAADGRAGAIAGPHRVIITTLQTKPDPKSPTELLTVAPERVPAKYNDKSTLTAKVPAEGTDKLDFDLRSK